MKPKIDKAQLFYLEVAVAFILVLLVMVVCVIPFIHRLYWLYST